jgi:hypothetical protein
MGVLGVELTLTLTENTVTKRDGGYVLAVQKTVAQKNQRAATGENSDGK